MRGRLGEVRTGDGAFWEIWAAGASHSAAAVPVPDSSHALFELLCLSPGWDSIGLENANNPAFLSNQPPELVDRDPATLLRQSLT